MKDYYRRFQIPNYEQIRKELLACIKHDYMSRPDTHSWVYQVFDVLEQCPSLEQFVVPRLKNKYTGFVQQIKFYCTPAQNYLDHHIDGYRVKVPFGMNLPLLNTEGTHQIWYHCPAENLSEPDLNVGKSRNQGGFLNAVYTPKDPEAMTILDKLELTTPAICKTDIMHNVVNPTDKTRLVVILRWNLYDAYYSEAEDVIDLSDCWI